MTLQKTPIMEKVRPLRHAAGSSSGEKFAFRAGYLQIRRGIRRSLLWAFHTGRVYVVRRQLVRSVAAQAAIALRQCAAYRPVAALAAGTATIQPGTAACK